MARLMYKHSRHERDLFVSRLQHCSVPPPTVKQIVGAAYFVCLTSHSLDSTQLKWSHSTEIAFDSSINWLFRLLILVRIHPYTHTISWKWSMCIVWSSIWWTLFRFTSCLHMAVRICGIWWPRWHGLDKSKRLSTYGGHNSSATTATIYPYKLCIITGESEKHGCERFACILHIRRT